MSSPASSSISNSQGSTKPNLAADRRAREAAKIREYWCTRPNRKNESAEVDQEYFNRHKSLVLELARQDYVQDREKISGEIDLEDYCRQFSWLGGPLAQSIMRLLEVQEYFDENPMSFERTKQVQWPSEGDQFLHFRVLEELGRGASGRVYLCEQRNLGDKRVVLKVVAGQNGSEPSLLGKLRHTSITPIHWADYDPTLDVSYICMPFLGRSTLVDLVKLAFQDGQPSHGSVVREAAGLWMSESEFLELEGELPNHAASRSSSYLTAIIELGRDLATALAFVHAQQIIHGDIKPSNVLLSPLGHPYLLDFNLSRRSHTWGGRYGGTPAYMAPEQLKAVLSGMKEMPSEGEGFSSDIYSFGVVLYELLTGKPPHLPKSKRESIETLAGEMLALQEKGYEGIGKVLPRAEKGMVSLVHSCLAIQPADRPQSMQEVAAELGRLNTRARRGRRLVRQRPRSAALLCSIFVGIAMCVASIYAAMPPLEERLYAQAIEAREQGDLRRTIELLTEALFISPDYSEARLLRARSYNEAHDYSKANVDIMHLRRTSFDPKTVAYDAYNDHFLGKPDSAVLGYEAAIRNGFKNSAVLNNLILDHFLSPKRTPPEEMTEVTQPLLQEALQLNPNSPQIRMTAFTFYRKHPRRFEPDILAATQEHIDWLVSNAPEYASVIRAIRNNYLTLARLDLVDQAVIDEANKKLASASISTPLPRFLDPLDCQR